jgi:uncharacterized protein
MLGKKGKGGETFTVFYVTDVHGSTICFKKFIGGAKFYGADMLILGGDVTGKMVVPIARQSNGVHLSEYAGQPVELHTDDEVARFRQRVEDMGFYPAFMSEEEFQEVLASPDAQMSLFRKLIDARLHEWFDWARPRIADNGIPVYAAPGNDDEEWIDDVIKESGCVELLEGRVVELDGLQMLSTGWSNITPWDTPRQCTEEELRARIVPMIEELRDPQLSVFNIHVPPYDTALDQCPELDEDLRPVSKGGNPVMASAGSTTVRELIETYQPVLGLHGHIHEGRGVVKLGRTTCVNPGSVYSEGVLNGSVIRLKAQQVTDVQLTSG